MEEAENANNIENPNSEESKKQPFAVKSEEEFDLDNVDLDAGFGLAQPQKPTRVSEINFPQEESKAKVEYQYNPKRQTIGAFNKVPENTLPFSHENNLAPIPEAPPQVFAASNPPAKTGKDEFEELFELEDPGVASNAPEIGSKLVPNNPPPAVQPKSGYEEFANYFTSTAPTKSQPVNNYQYPNPQQNYANNKPANPFDGSSSNYMDPHGDLKEFW